MLTKHNFPENTTYRVTNKDGIRVRGTPDTSHDGNLVKVNGVPVRLTMGKTFPVYKIHVVPSTGWVFGIITPPEAEQAHYVCLWNLNTVFAMPLENPVQLPNEKVLNPDWVQAVDEYLRATNIPLPPPFKGR